MISSNISEFTDPASGISFSYPSEWNVRRLPLTESHDPMFVIVKPTTPSGASLEGTFHSSISIIRNENMHLTIPGLMTIRLRTNDNEPNFHLIYQHTGDDAGVMRFAYTALESPEHIEITYLDILVEYRFLKFAGKVIEIWLTSTESEFAEVVQVADLVLRKLRS